MLFGNIFKSGKRSGGRRRKVTAKDVIEHLDGLEATTANCMVIRDHLGNDTVEDCGQVDFYRVSDERLFVVDNGIHITAPQGMKGVVDGNFAEIVDDADVPADAEDHDDEAERDGEDEGEEQEESGDAFSGGDSGRRQEPEQLEEQALGVGQVIRLRIFFSRIPYEIDCQIVERFTPTSYRNVDLTPRWGVGYRIRPLGDVRKRDQRRYVRYTHRLGFGHLRMRNEIQFNVFAHRTNLEISEKDALKQTITEEDFQVVPFGKKDVDELRNAERVEDVVEFFMGCMVQNATEHCNVYASKAYLDRLHRSSLEGLGYFGVVGAQQTTVLPKIFIKRQPKGESVLEKQMGGRSNSRRDAGRKMRAMEEMHDRYTILTREHKIYQQRRLGKSVVGDFENDVSLVGFFSPYGLHSEDHATVRQFVMPAEVTDMGVENITLKPSAFEDARSRELDYKEYVRQDDGFQADLLNFSVGGAQLRGGESPEVSEAFLQYLVGEEAEDLPFAERIEILQKYAVLLNIYPVLNFTRAQIADYKPYLPYRIPVIARVARFQTVQAKENEEPRIESIGFDFIYNPIADSYSRDINDYGQWEQITPYTENHHLIEVHKSIQLLFGFDRALEESLREDRAVSRDEEGGEEEEEEEEATESAD